MNKNVRRKLKRMANALKKAFSQKKYIREFEYKPQKQVEYIYIPVNIGRKEGKQWQNGLMLN